MKKSLLITSLGIGAVIVGVGAGVGLAFLAVNRSSPSPNLAIANISNIGTTASLCQFNALDAVTDSLNQVRAVNAIAYDPIPTVASLASNLKPDLLIQLTPAPFPKISDRASRAKVPILMYHDISEKKSVDWDITPTDFAQQMQEIKDQGLTPITMEQLVNHLRTGAALPEKPILLTFDDNYIGQYKYALPLLKQYRYPAVWSVHTRYVGSQTGKPKATWEQLREIHQSGLVTIASHTVNHFNLLKLTDVQIEQELKDSKAELERNLGIKVRYFTYPEGSYSQSITKKVAEAGYEAALSMSLDASLERPANQSEDILSIMRYGQSRFKDAIAVAYGGEQSEPIFSGPATSRGAIDFTKPVQLRKVTINKIPLTLIYGGKPVTVHADRRAAVEEIKKQTSAIAAVDGAFFSLESLESNKMIGPVLSQFSSKAGIYDPGRSGENPLLKNRPLVLISGSDIKFIPYDPVKHSTLEQIQAELPKVTDAFVGAGWLVRNGNPQPAANFGKLYGFDAHRDRAFWGIDRSGRPVIGVTMEMIDSVGLGEILTKAGLYEVVMLDSGASAALAYRGKSLMTYTPRPVPHIVALLPPDPAPIVQNSLNQTLSCPVTTPKTNPDNLSSN